MSRTERLIAEKNENVRSEPGSVSAQHEGKHERDNEITSLFTRLISRLSSWTTPPWLKNGSISEKSPLKKMTQNYDSHSVLPAKGEGSSHDRKSGFDNTVFDLDENDNEEQSSHLPPSPPQSSIHDSSNRAKQTDAARYQVSFYQLFSFSDQRDCSLILIGTLAAILNGASFPVFLYVFGSMNGVLASNVSWRCTMG